MATQVAAAANLAMAIAAMIATGEATRMKITEAEKDYGAEIARLKAQQTAQEKIATAEISRQRTLGTATLQEKGAQGEFDTRSALFRLEQTASAAESRLGASGVRAAGTPAAAQQQSVDLAYIESQRIAQSRAADIKIGGMSLGSQLMGGEEQKSLLTMGYEQNLAEQKRKLSELKANKSKMITFAYLGGLAGVTSSFYQSASAGSWDWMKKKSNPVVGPAEVNTQPATPYSAPSAAIYGGL